MVEQLVNFASGQIIKFVYNGKQRFVEVERIALSKDKKQYLTGREHSDDMMIKSFRIDRMESEIVVVG